MSTSSGKGRQGFTLIEVVVSLMIVGISMGGIISMYAQSALRSEYSAQALAAQMMAIGAIEQVRAAKFDPQGSPPVDELVSTNFPSRFDVLDVGYSSPVATYATNTITISTVSTNPVLKMVRIDCTWRFSGRSGIITNTVYTYRAPNQ
jgi:prepilin-type N-terminal cleavage/methylation domain-containing protein